MHGHLLRDFEPAAVLQGSRDAGGAEGVTTDLPLDAAAEARRRIMRHTSDWSRELPVSSPERPLVVRNSGPLRSWAMRQTRLPRLQRPHHSSRLAHSKTVSVNRDRST
jgi:hypothetical protein